MYFSSNHTLLSFLSMQTDKPSQKSGNYVPLSLFVQLFACSDPGYPDFAKLGEAMAAALGLERGVWLAKYHDHRRNAVRRTIDSSPVAVQCLRFIELGYNHQGTVKELLDRLNDLRFVGIEEKEYWPRTPRGLGDILRRIAPGMRLLGVHLSVENKPKRDGVHCVLRKIPGSTLAQT